MEESLEKIILKGSFLKEIGLVEVFDIEYISGVDSSKDTHFVESLVLNFG